MKLLKLWVLLPIAIALPFCAFSQNSEILWTPEFSYSWKQTDQLGFKSKLAMFNSISNIDNEEVVQYIEPQLSASYKLPSGTTISGGYLYRLSTPLIDGYQYEHRLMQQIGFSSAFGERDFSHRFRLEQRFRTNNTYQNRARYRLGHTISLQDSNVGYLTINNEFLGLFNKDFAAGENRFLIGLGWITSQKQKFQLGFQYRTQNLFNTGGLTHQFVISTSLSLKQ